MAQEELKLPHFSKEPFHNKDDFMFTNGNACWYNEAASVKDQSLVNKVNSIKESGTASRYDNDQNKFAVSTDNPYQNTGSEFNPFGLATLFPYENMFASHWISSCGEVSKYTNPEDFWKRLPLGYQPQSCPATYEYMSRIVQNTTNVNKKLLEIRPKPTELQLRGDDGAPREDGFAANPPQSGTRKRKRRKTKTKEKYMEYTELEKNEEERKSQKSDKISSEPVNSSTTENDNNGIQMEDVESFLQLINPSHDIESNMFIQLSRVNTVLADDELEKTAKEAKEGTEVVEKPLESFKQKKQEDCVDGDNGTDHVLARLLPDAFTIWKEKYRDMVKEEYPEVDKLTLELKLHEIWEKIPAEHREKYYEKANAILKRYRASLGTCSYMNRTRKKKTHESNMSWGKNKEMTLLKPKPIRLQQTPRDKSKTNEQESDIMEHMEEDGDFPSGYDYTKALRETMTYNSPDKYIKKKLARMKHKDETMNFIDENEIATGFLQDIMMAYNNTDNEPSFECENLACDDLAVNSGTLDVSELDSYLTGEEGFFNFIDDLGAEVDIYASQPFEGIDAKIEERRRRNREQQRLRRLKKRKLTDIRDVMKQQREKRNLEYNEVPQKIQHEEIPENTAQNDQQDGLCVCNENNLTDGYQIKEEKKSSKQEMREAGESTDGWNKVESASLDANNSEQKRLTWPEVGGEETTQQEDGDEDTQEQRHNFSFHMKTRSSKRTK